VTVIAAKPTVYSGIQFRSRLEARWARFFDAIEWEWIYEPSVPELEGIQYQPDFLVSKPEYAEPILIEVKPLTDDSMSFEQMRELAPWASVVELTASSFVLLVGEPGRWKEGALVAPGHVSLGFDPGHEMVWGNFAECEKCGKLELWAFGHPRCCPIGRPTGKLLDAYSAVRRQSYEDAP
jgi:hypothetical protein